MSFFSDAAARPLGRGSQAPAGCILDDALARTLLAYKRTVAGRYRSLAPEEIESLPEGPMFVSPKVDGHMWFMVLQDGHPYLVNPAGRVLFGEVPLLVEARAAAARFGAGRAIFAGELWAATRQGQTRPRFDGVPEALGGEGNAEVGRLGWYGFDVVEAGGRTGGSPSDPYADRLALLTATLGDGRRVKAIRTDEVRSHGDVRRLYAELAASGKAEGLVVRTRDGRIHKIKPTLSLDAAVVGYTERADAPEQVRSVLLAFMRPDGQLQLAGSCGSLGNDADRGDLLRQLQPTLCASDYRFAARSGELYRFVEPQMVLEVRVTDLQTDSASGRDVARMVLRFDSRSGYHAVRPLPGVSFIHPVLVRVRTDKRVNVDDVRVSQVSERIEVAEVDAAAVAAHHSASTLLCREVFVKETKGVKAVRKLLVWRTNKDLDDAAYPAFVVVWVDYSPGRKEPLTRDVRLAATLEQAERIAAEMRPEGEKRGWVRVAPPA